MIRRVCGIEDEYALHALKVCNWVKKAWALIAPPSFCYDFHSCTDCSNRIDVNHKHGQQGKNQQREYDYLILKCKIPHP